MFYFNGLFITETILLDAKVAYLVPDTYESARTISTGPPSKGGSKIGKANGYAGVSKHGSKAVSSVCLLA